MFSIEFLFSETPVTVKNTCGSGMGTPSSWGPHACQACVGHVLFNKTAGWQGSVDTSFWKGKNGLKWISVYRSFQFWEEIILKIKVKSSGIESKNGKRTCLHAKVHTAKLNREGSLDWKVKDEHSKQTWSPAAIKLILSRF